MLFDIPSGTRPSASTPRAVPIDASVSAIAAYTPPWTMPIGWHTPGRTGQVARAPADLVGLVDDEADRRVERVLDGYSQLVRRGVGHGAEASVTRWARARGRAITRSRR